MTHSVNNDEINKFSSLSKDWWDLNGKFKIFHKFNKARIQFIHETLTNKYPQLMQNTINMIDIGCGVGVLAESLLQNISWNNSTVLTGIDASPDVIIEAKRHSKENNLNINYIHKTAEDVLVENPNTYDIVFIMDVIEHVDNLPEFLHTVSKLLKPNGLIFVSTLSKNIKSLVLAKFMAEYVLNWVPKGTHDFKKFITPSTLNNLMQNNHLSLVEQKGIDLNLLNNSWQLANNISINYIACYQLRS